MRLAPANLEFGGVRIEMSTAVPRRTGVVGFKSRLNIGDRDSCGASWVFEDSVRGVSFSTTSFSGVALPEVEWGDVAGKPSMCPEVIAIPHSFGCNFSHWLMDHANTNARNLNAVGAVG